ncbi:GerAB/ArcD/ProY family transporter [Paenibacillus sp. strain BS8-2]
MRQGITSKQAIRWMSLYYIGSAILVLPSTLTTVAGQDAWLSVIVGCCVQFLIIPVYYFIAEQKKGQTLVSFLMGKWNKWIVRSTTVFFIFGFPFLICILTLRNVGDFMSSVVFIETPILAINILVVAVVVYAVIRGFPSIALAAELLFPIVLVLLLILFVSQLTDVNIDHLKPVMEHSPLTIVRASIPFAAFPNMEAVLVLFVSHHFLHNSGKKLLSIWLSSIFISTAAFFLTTLLSIALMGEGMTSILIYPSYMAAKLVNIGDFYERIEPFIAIAWIISIFFRMALLFYISVHTLSEVFQLKNPRSLVVPLSVIALVFADIVIDNTPFLLRFFSVWPLYASMFALLFPLAWLWIGRDRIHES